MKQDLPTLRKPGGGGLRSAQRFVRAFLAFAGRRTLLAGVLVTLGALLEGIGMLLLIPILGVVLGQHGGNSWISRAAGAALAALPASTRFGQLAQLMALFALLMALRAVVITNRDTVLAKLRLGFLQDQLTRVTSRLAAARWDVVARLRHARIAHLMSGDIQRTAAGVHFLLDGVVALAMLIVQVVLTFILAPLLAAISFAMLIAGAIMLIPILRSARAMGEYVTGSNLALMNTSVQFLGGLKLAISQNLQNGFVAEYAQTLDRLHDRQIQFQRLQTRSRLAHTTLSALVAAALVLIGFGMLGASPTVLIALLLILSRMSGPAGRLQQGAQQLMNCLPAFEKVSELDAELAAAARPEGAGAPAAAAFPLGPIEFQRVSYRHTAANENAGEAALHELSLVLAPGSFTGISGPSGAGKTTFADLLAGLFPPQTGRIIVAGRALEGAALIAWRNGTGYVSQDPFLFHDTVRHNLMWAAPAASEAELWEALARVGADALVRRMEMGLDTVVGERGTLISGGERQRLALARAILRKPQLLLLDEATNAIDIAAERAVLEAILALTPRPTIVLIAHRMESLELCDRVLAMEHGRFVADREGEAPIRKGLHAT